MPDTSYDGYVDENGLFHVPSSPEEEAILKKMGLKKWTLPSSSFELDPSGAPVDYTPDPTKVFKVNYVPPSTTGVDLNAALLDQAAAQVGVVDTVGRMNDNLSKLTADQNQTDYNLATLGAAEQFRRTQRPLARAAATGGYGPGQLARLARESGIDYNLASGQRDAAFQYAQATIAQQLEAAKANRTQQQLEILGDLVVKPTDQQLLLEQMLKG